MKFPARRRRRPGPDRDNDDLANALALFEQLWAEMQDSVFVQQALGTQITRLPDIGFLALFAPSAYGGAWLLGSIHGLLSGFRFETAACVGRYLDLVDEYGRLVRQMTERTIGQAERGIRMPARQIDPTINLLTGMKASATSALMPSADRLAEAGESAAACIREKIKDTVLPAFTDLECVIADPAERKSTPIWFACTRRSI